MIGLKINNKQIIEIANHVRNRRRSYEDFFEDVINLCEAYHSALRCDGCKKSDKTRFIDLNVSLAHFCKQSRGLVNDIADMPIGYMETDEIFEHVKKGKK